MKVGIHAIIEGRVQGVWFRESTKKKALKLGLTGWVKNLPDGRVELMAYGEKTEIKLLKDWLHHGPPLAKVSQVTVDEIPFEALQGFEVLR